MFQWSSNLSNGVNLHLCCFNPLKSVPGPSTSAVGSVFARPPEKLENDFIIIYRCLFLLGFYYSIRFYLLQYHIFEVFWGTINIHKHPLKPLNEWEFADVASIPSASVTLINQRSRCVEARPTEVRALTWHENSGETWRESKLNRNNIILSES